MVFRGWRVCASERGHSGSRLIGSWLPLNAPPFVPIPLVGISATSCPHLCPKSLGHRCGHVVADKPTEDSAAEGKASSKLVVTTPGCFDFWKPTTFGKDYIIEGGRGVYVVCTNIHGNERFLCNHSGSNLLLLDLVLCLSSISVSQSIADLRHRSSDTITVLDSRVIQTALPHHSSVCDAAE